MNSRSQRPAASMSPVPGAPRPHVAPVHRGPQALSSQAAFHHAPNAALLIDFDNVTMGIRSDLASELRHLLASDIIKGKVAVQRAYADWRRYPQYIVPLAESSIDMIMAPAYGSSKKNATDIRLAVDAIELVFTRPEIGTFILLSGDSDFASLVTKLKEYGKYVIGVGIRESSSDLLVMNCDEYYSYNALAGLVKQTEEDTVRRDAWELVLEAMERMVKQGDVKRSDRLKQVMQDIDPSFDEKDLGYPKFSKFCQEAASRGLISLTRMENGQFEVGPAGARSEAPPAQVDAAPEADAAPREARDSEEEDGRPDRDGRRRRRGRGRGRGEDRGPREAAPAGADTGDVSDEMPIDVEPIDVEPEAPVELPEPAVVAAAPADDDGVIGRSGERLTRAEAFDLVRRSVEVLVQDDDGAVRARDVRVQAYQLLGRDSESLSERNFPRILKDAHDAELIDLRRRGDDYEVSRPSGAAPIEEQLNQAAAAHAPVPPVSTAPRGMKSRGIGASRGGRSRLPEPPADLFSVGVVEDVPARSTGNSQAPAARAEASRPEQNTAPAAEPRTTEPAAAVDTSSAPPERRPSRRGGRKAPAKSAKSAAAPAAKTAAKSAAKAPAKSAAKSAAKGAGKTPAKTAGRSARKSPAKTAPRKEPATTAPSGRRPAAKRGQA